MRFHYVLAVLTVGCINSVNAVDAKGTKPPITAVAFAPDGKSIVATSQSGVHQFSWPALDWKRTVETEAANLNTVAFSPSGDRLAVGGGGPAEEGTVEIFSWPECESLTNIDFHDDVVMSVQWLGDLSIASGSLDHRVIIWNANTGEKARTLNGHSRGIVGLCLLRDQNRLVSTGIDQSLRVWDLETGELVRSMSIHTMRVHDVAVRPGNAGLPMVASASDDRTVRLWQPTIGRMVRFVNLTSKPLDVEWLMDGSMIVVACADGHVRLIDPEKVEVTQDIPALDGWAYSIAVHPTDGRIVVGGVAAGLRRIRIQTDQ